MTRQISYQSYQDVYEYHGNTIIHLIRKLGTETIWQDWLLFDSVEDASEYFNTNCSAGEA